MVIKYLALKTVEVADERVSQDGGVIHSPRDSAAWRAYFELKERERGLKPNRDGEIPTDMEGHYFL